MKIKDWESVEDGTVIHNDIDGYMTVWSYDYYGNDKIKCLTSEISIYPAFQFDPNDWEIEMPYKEGD